MKHGLKPVKYLDVRHHPRQHPSGREHRPLPLRRTVSGLMMVALAAMLVVLAGWRQAPQRAQSIIQENPSCGQQDNGTKYCQATIGLPSGGAIEGDDELGQPTPSQCISAVGYDNCWWTAGGTTLWYASAGTLYTGSTIYDSCTGVAGSMKMVANSSKSAYGAQVASPYAYGHYQDCTGGHPGYIAGSHYRNNTDGFYYLAHQV